MIPKRVAIVSVAQTKYEEAKQDKELSEIIFQVTRRALDQAGLTRGDVDSVVIAAHDLVDGRSIADMVTATAAGAYHKDVIRVCEDGIFAAALAYARILSAIFEVSLVVAWGKASEGAGEVINHLSFDPLYHRPLGLNEVSSYGIRATRYLQKHGISEEQCAKVVVKNRHNAALGNPLAHLRAPVGLGEVLRSKVISWPIKLLDTAPKTDGACAMVLASEKRAREISGNLAWVKGASWCTDSYYMGERDLDELKSLRLAASRAYEMAGIKEPVRQIDVAEVYDLFSFLELMEYEALGFCGQGEGAKFLESGIPQMEGELPVNPSGGVLSSNPKTASGLVRLAEASLQVMNLAEGRQVPEVRTALAHGISGLCGQSHCVFIVGKQESY